MRMATEVRVVTADIWLDRGDRLVEKLAVAPVVVRVAIELLQHLDEIVLAFLIHSLHNGR